MTPGPIIYNLFPRLVGPMKLWIPHIRRARDMGFDTVYVNPFHYPGYSGSLYAPKDYRGYNPLFVDGDPRPGHEQLGEVVAAARGLGMRFMMDLVINHTAFDCPLVKEHPEWYKREPDGSVVHPFAIDPADARKKHVWGDLAEIDNDGTTDRPGLWHHWVDLVLYYMTLGVTDFRCDAAYKVPPDLWRLIIGTARCRDPRIRFVAETLGCRLEEVAACIRSGFDYLFNSSKYWNLADPWCLQQYETYRPFTPSIAFPESHDTPRLAQELEGNEAAVKMRYALAAFFSAGVMSVLGFEWGFTRALDVVGTQPADMEQPKFDISAFITQVNAVKRQHPIFNVEAPTVMVSGPQAPVFIMKKTWKADRALVIINKSLTTSERFFFPDWDRWLDWPSFDLVVDISPGRRLERVGLPLDVTLEPAQVMVIHATDPVKPGCARPADTVST
ncbi:MAG: alpha-amylase [Candidatus Riflebacteria bacterium]|nr:alpha-amylase [Candidatus Riflebacteria bacterium]